MSEVNIDHAEVSVEGDVNNGEGRKGQGKKKCDQDGGTRFHYINFIFFTFFFHDISSSHCGHLEGACKH